MQAKEILKSQWYIQKQQNKELLYSMRYSLKINKLYYHLFSKSVIILSLLRDKLDIKKITVRTKTGSILRTTPTKEIKELNTMNENITLHLIPPIRQKYICMKVLYLYYPQLLDKLETMANFNNVDIKEYEDINFDEERQRLKDNLDLIKDFAVI